MLPEDVLNHYGTLYRFGKQTKMTPPTLANWLKWGFVPLNAQYRLQVISGGKLKAQSVDKFNALKAWLAPKADAV